MPPFRVTYWTGIWEPHREGISKEVAWLRRELSPGSPVVSFTPQSSALLAGERVLRLNVARWIPLRATALALERTGRVTHVFGGVGTGHFLYVLGRRPTVLTVVVGGPPLATEAYARVDRFVAESRELQRALIGAGIAPERIDVIYPANDLSTLADIPAPDTERFTVVFASTPADVADIDARGLGLLIELARARPDIDVYVQWRQWGAVAEARRVLESRQPPANFIVDHHEAVSAADIYRRAHATVCAFEAGTGKSAPNSVIEGLAAGRPALVTDTCGIADLVQEWEAGVVTPRSVAGLAEGVDVLRARYASARQQARRLADQEFNVTSALTRYDALYRKLATR